MTEDLLNHLKSVVKADPNLYLASLSLHEVADIIAEIERLRAKVAKYEARLEIDHAFRLPEEGETGDPITRLVRFEIPENERETYTDKVTCLDVEVAHLEEILHDIHAVTQAMIAKMENGEMGETGVFEGLRSIVAGLDFYAWNHKRRMEKVAKEEPGE